jgi:hypothetical protein
MPKREASTTISHYCHKDRADDHCLLSAVESMDSTILSFQSAFLLAGLSQTLTDIP